MNTTQQSARAVCPICHASHTVPAEVVGMSDWNLCRACGEQVDAERRQNLARRGIHLAGAKSAPIRPELDRICAYLSARGFTVAIAGDCVQLRDGSWTDGERIGDWGRDGQLITTVHEFRTMQEVHEWERSYE